MAIPETVLMQQLTRLQLPYFVQHYPALVNGGENPRINGDEGIYSPTCS